MGAPKDATVCGVGWRPTHAARCNHNRYSVIGICGFAIRLHASLHPHGDGGGQEATVAHPWRARFRASNRRDNVPWFPRNSIRIQHQRSNIRRKHRVGYRSDTRRFGRRIVAGDSLIIIYDGARPSRSVIWGLAAKSLPDKSVPPASARSKRRLGSTVATFGIALIVLVGGPLISKVRRDVPSSVVTKCDARHSHVYYFDLTTDRGETFTVSSQDLPDWKSCLPAGTVLEKRAGEAGWRMDGTYRSPEQPTFAITLVLFSLGILLG